MKQLKALVIGCGSIGALKPYRYDNPRTKNPLTHAHAYKQHPGTNLAGVVDADEKKTKEAARRWNCKGFQHVDQALNKTRPDIVSICVPTHAHLDVLSLVTTTHKPKLIILEKPCGINQIQCLHMQKIVEKRNTPVLVNYTRRFSINYRLAQARVTEFAKRIYHARLVYARGLKRDGCHAIDLFHWFFGRIRRRYVTHYITDFPPGGKSISVVFDTERCPNVVLAAVDSRRYGDFSFDIFTDVGRWSFDQYGKVLNVYFPTKEKIYGSYPVLPPKPTYSMKTDLTQCLYKLVDNAVRHICYNEALHCTLSYASEVHLVMDAMDAVENDLAYSIFKGEQE
jgi:predicted dehydrogenase